jgi:hypothetical protein
MAALKIRHIFVFKSQWCGAGPFKKLKLQRGISALLKLAPGLHVKVMYGDASCHADRPNILAQGARNLPRTAGF